MIKLCIKDLEQLKNKKGDKNLLLVCSVCGQWNFPDEKITEIANELEAEIIRYPPLCNNPDVDLDIGYDSIFVLGCGACSQIIARNSKSRVIPAVDTCGVGVKKQDEIAKWCIGCRNCILELTQGICPVARCPKFLLNGPCGGVQQGMCELGDRPCVWIQIFSKLKSEGRLREFLETRENE